MGMRHYINKFTSNQINQFCECVQNIQCDKTKTEITNTGKPDDIAEKIAKGKITKFLNDNSLLNQLWIIDPKKKVSDVLKENSQDKPLKILDFIRYKVGEGV